VVIGLLEPDGRIDIKRTTDMVQYARPMQVTFHRAFDRAKDPLDALEDVIKTGADRILTSGQAPTAFEGREMIKKLVEKAAGRIKIIAGGGINPQNVLEIIEYTGVTEVHASCATKIESEMIYNNGFEIPRDIIQTDPELVRGITNLLKKR